MRRNGRDAPIPAVRMSWVAPGGVTETLGLGRHNFGGFLPKGGRARRPEADCFSVTKYPQLNRHQPEERHR
jgi:hypothetical protein